MGSLPFHWLHCHEFITNKTGFIAISWVRCLSHGDTLPNKWGHVANTKYMYNTYGDRLLLHGEPPRNINSAREFVDESLSIAMHAMKAGVHTTLGSSPGSLVFNRDMFLNIPLITDWHAITQRREHLINENLIRENQKRRRFDYLPNQRVLRKKRWNPRKLDKRTTGPYRILQTHVNGTVTIEL
jgi:hypothetical protein